MIPGWKFEKKKDPSFKFLDEPHEYHFQTRKLWSPSMVFVEVRYVDRTYYNDEHLYRGTYVHWCTRLSDQGELDWADVAGEYIGYLEAYEDFKAVWKFKPRLIEVPMYHPHLFYGVTPDREGIILDGDAAIVELKSGHMPWWTKYQTAAQELAVAAWDRTPQPRRRRVGVELSKNGKFRAKEFRDPDDFETWRANLKTCHSHYAEPPQALMEDKRY